MTLSELLSNLSIIEHDIRKQGINPASVQVFLQDGTVGDGEEKPVNSAILRTRNGTNRVIISNCGW